MQLQRGIQGTRLLPISAKEQKYPFHGVFSLVKNSPKMVSNHATGASMSLYNHFGTVTQPLVGKSPIL